MCCEDVMKGYVRCCDKVYYVACINQVCGVCDACGIYRAVITPVNH